MSIDLDRSNGVECKAYPKDTLNGSIIVGEYEIDPEDFCDLIIYYITNTDLYLNDPRTEMLNRLWNLKIVQGFDPTGYRLREEDSEI